MNELASITTEELGLLLEELHEPKFRTSQVMKWLAKGVPPKEMLNIPKRCAKSFPPSLSAASASLNANNQKKTIPQKCFTKPRTATLLRVF